MSRFPVLFVFFLLGSTSFCQAADTSGGTLSSPAPDLSQYRLEEVLFEGSRSFSAEQLRDTFNVPVGDKFNHTALARIIRETPARGVLVDEIGAKVLAALV
jgi:outer membrane protein assembly factor BamA